MARDEVRRNFRGDDYALTSEMVGGSASDHIVSLENDSRLHDDPPSAYPYGFSVMLADDVGLAGSFGDMQDRGQVHTSRHRNTADTADEASQLLWSAAEFRGFLRKWDSVGEFWSNWDRFSMVGHTHTSGNITDFADAVNVYVESGMESVSHIVLLGAGSFGEADAITLFPSGLSILPAAGAANWGPNTGQAGHVVTERNGSEGKQTFHQYSNATSYQRTYTGAAWGAWTALIVEGDFRLTDARTPTAHAATHTNGTDDIQNATAAQKGLATATQITKLDGIETAATADQTAAEILTAIKTVDGTGSGLDADTLDGVEASGLVATSRTISTTAPLTGGGDLSANRTLAISAASDTAAGAVELATDAEVQTGTDTTRAITAANLTARTATETRTGVVELATDAETQTGTDTARAITPANLTARTPTETRAGVIELATQAETNTGTDDVRAVTPLKLKTNVDLHINDTSAAHAASAISYAGGTGMSATDVEAAIDELATEKVNTGTTPQYSTHFYGSTLSVQTGVGRDYIFDAGTITAVAATVNTASSSGSISLSFKKNGVQFTTLSITASSNSTTTAGLSTAVAAGDYITVDITGAGTGSADLVAKVRYVV